MRRVVPIIACIGLGAVVYTLISFPHSYEERIARAYGRLPTDMRRQMETKGVALRQLPTSWQNLLKEGLSVKIDQQKQQGKTDVVRWMQNDLKYFPDLVCCASPMHRNGKRYMCVILQRATDHGWQPEFSFDEIPYAR